MQHATYAGTRVRTARGLPVAPCPAYLDQIHQLVTRFDGTAPRVLISGPGDGAIVTAVLDAAREAGKKLQLLLVGRPSTICAAWLEIFKDGADVGILDASAKELDQIPAGEIDIAIIDSAIFGGDTFTDVRRLIDARAGLIVLHDAKTSTALHHAGFVNAKAAAGLLFDTPLYQAGLFSLVEDTMDKKRGLVIARLVGTPVTVKAPKKVAEPVTEAPPADETITEPAEPVTEEPTPSETITETPVEVDPAGAPGRTGTQGDVGADGPVEDTVPETPEVKAPKARRKNK